MQEIDNMIDANYESVNNGVYNGFARTQEAYDEAVALFQRLDQLETHLDGREWLVGEGKGRLTEADICLFTTLVRFDLVYVVHFKCIFDASLTIQTCRRLLSVSSTYLVFERLAIGTTSKRIISGRIKTSTPSESSHWVPLKGLTQSDDESTICSTRNKNRGRRFEGSCPTFKRHGDFGPTEMKRRLAKLNVSEEQACRHGFSLF